MHHYTDELVDSQERLYLIQGAVSIMLKKIFRIDKQIISIGNKEQNNFALSFCLAYSLRILWLGAKTIFFNS
jgi:hypothetical protein